MKTKSLVLAIAFSAFSGTALADVFNMPPGQTSLEFVEVGNAGNAGKSSGAGAGGSGPDRICGAVDHQYKIGKFEVTAAQYTEFLNAVAATDAHGLYNVEMADTSPSNGCNIQRSGTPGSHQYSVESSWANRPVNYVSWGDAARFANWLTNGQPTGSQNLTTTEDGSYLLNGAVTDASLLTVTRKANARYVIPSEDEWYKAAYHKNDGVTGNYWDYPTASNAIPSNVLSGPDPGNNANYKVGISGFTIGSPFYRTSVGDFENSESAYGTFDQGGNIWEWNEGILNGIYRIVRGGAYYNASIYLHAAVRDGITPYGPSTDYHSFGFRIVEVIDCNNNGIPDAQDISDGTSQDCNSNFIPDECELEPTYLLVASIAGSPGTILRFRFRGTGPASALEPLEGGNIESPSGLTFDSRGELFAGSLSGDHVARILFDSTGNATANGVIAGNSLSNPTDLNFSPAGELFVASRNNGRISRFTFGTGATAVANGIIDTGGPASYGLAVGPASELFFAYGDTSISRYLINPVTGIATPNGSFTIPGHVVQRYMDGDASGELFIPDHDTHLVYRYIFDAQGNAVAHGTISVPSAIGVAVNAEREVFVAGHSGGGIYRFILQPDGTAMPNGMISTPPWLSSVAVRQLTSGDCNIDNIPDDCQLADNDCNENGTPDECDVVDSTEKVYWTDVEGADALNATIKRANVDGSHLQTVWTGLSHIRGLAIDSPGGKLYWTSPGTSCILRANIDGSGLVETLINDTSNATSGIALDTVAGKMYWTESDADNINGKIRRANLDGSSPEELVSTGLQHPAAIALDVQQGKVYWTDLQGNQDGTGRLQRANLDGSSVETLISDIDEANGLALDSEGSKLYWPEISTGKIQRANLDGSAVEDLVLGVDAPTTVALDLNRSLVYWTDSNSGGQTNRIERANLDGSDREVVVSGVGFPWGIGLQDSNALSQDCNLNGSPDECELLGNDCNENYVPDECDPDADDDGVTDVCDNCVAVSNPNQVDCNNDGIGNACEPDCDGNGTPDGCEPNIDNDGIPAGCDVCPETYDPSQFDSDGDGLGDLCDNCPGVDNPEQEDCDNDGYGDACRCSGERGDMNDDGSVNAADVQLFVERLLGGP